MRESSGDENGRLAFLRALHAEAHASFRRYEIERAQDLTDDALDVAMNLRSRPYFLDLMNLRASVNLYRQDISAAADDCADLLEELQDQPSDLRNDGELGIQPDVREVRTLIQYAGVELLLAHLDLTEQLLDRASQVLIPFATGESRLLTPEHELLSTRILYTRSLLASARGEVDAAWMPALEAARRFTDAGHAGNAVRAEFHAMDTLVDLSLSLPEGTAAQHIALMADAHLKSAIRRAYQANDDGMFNLVILASASVARLLNRSQDSAQFIKGVIDRAEQPHDIMVLTQAYTALGEQYAFQGEVESALACYRRALIILEEGEVPFLGLRARRALDHFARFGTL